MEDLVHDSRWYVELKAIYMVGNNGLEVGTFIVDSFVDQKEAIERFKALARPLNDINQRMAMDKARSASRPVVPTLQGGASREKPSAEARGPDVRSVDGSELGGDPPS